MTIDYDAGSLTGWCGLPCLLLRWRGTIWHGALLGPMFWFTILLHIALLILGGRIPLYLPDISGESGSGEGSGDDEGLQWVLWEPFSLPVLPWPPAVVGLTLLFFFIVFYGNSSYQRFYTLYGHCVGIGGTTMEWVSLVKAHSVGLDEPALSTAQWNTTRYILAAAHILYYALHGDSISEDEWQMMGARELLSAGELEVLKAYKGFKPFLAVSWGLDAAKAMCAQTGERDNGWSSWQFREVAFKFRGHCGQIINLLKQPVPFPYFHLLNVIMLLQLLLLSYALAGFPLIAPYFSTTIIGFSTVVLLGMRGLAVQLSNPFGNDAVDFEIEKFMLGSYSNAVAHLRSADIVLDVFDLPPKMRNPLSPTLTSKDEKAIKLAWEKSPEDVGQIKDDDRIFSDGFVNMFSGATKGLTDTMSNAATGAVSTASNACSNTMQAGTTVMSSSIGDMSSSDDKGGGTIGFPTRAASCGGMPEGATTFVEKSTTNPPETRIEMPPSTHAQSGTVILPTTSIEIPAADPPRYTQQQMARPVSAACMRARTAPRPQPNAAAMAARAEASLRVPSCNQSPTTNAPRCLTAIRSTPQETYNL